jgi:hypothetical protein
MIALTIDSERIGTILARIQLAWLRADGIKQAPSSGGIPIMDPKHPVIGDQHIDATDIVLVDVTPDIINSYVKFRAGADKAMANVERLKPEEIERAGINEKSLQLLADLIKDYRHASELLAPAEKLAEKLYETKLERAHRISQLFGEICAQARRRAERDPKGAEILGPLEDLLAYQLAPAKKATATKEKAKAAAETTPPAATPGSHPA